MSWETLLHYDKVGLSFVDSEVHDHSSLIPQNLTRDGGLEYSEMRFPVLSASMSQIQVQWLRGIDYLVFEIDKVNLPIL